ncbi:MAG: hypothetical protein EOO39_24010, partial [Cytophagaceae bacterium]
MRVRNVSMVMSFFCLMLTGVFALSGVLYDYDRFLWPALGYFIFGSLYFMAVLVLALLHDIM